MRSKLLAQAFISYALKTDMSTSFASFSEIERVMILVVNFFTSYFTSVVFKNWPFTLQHVHNQFSHLRLLRPVGYNSFCENLNNYVMHEQIKVVVVVYLLSITYRLQQNVMELHSVCVLERNKILSILYTSFNCVYVPASNKIIMCLEWDVIQCRKIKM